MLYCVHRYFFSRDSTYFSARFAQLDIRDHEPLSTIISLGDIETKDFDAFLSILYPEYVFRTVIYWSTYRGVSASRDFEGADFSYEEWKSVLHLSTRWGFASIRRLALGSINPPTPHDRLLLARTYSIDDWVIPALSALCERTTPLSLPEARQMSIEDVVLVSTVREDIRSRTLQVDSAEIPLRVEAEQLGALGLEIPDHLRFPKHKGLSTVDLKRVRAHEGDGSLSVSPSFGESVSDKIDECLQAEERSPGNMSVLKAEPAQIMRNSQGEVAATRMADTCKEGIQKGAPEEDNDGVATCTSMPTSNLQLSPPMTSSQQRVYRGFLDHPFFLPTPWEEASPCRLANCFLSVTGAVAML